MPKFSPLRGNTTLLHFPRHLFKLSEHRDVFLSVKLVNNVNVYNKKSVYDVL